MLERNIHKLPLEIRYFILKHLSYECLSTIINDEYFWLIKCKHDNVTKIENYTWKESYAIHERYRESLKRLSMFNVDHRLLPLKDFIDFYNDMKSITL